MKMPAKCKELCHEYKEKYSQARCYTGTRRYCSICQGWTDEEITRCPCCNQQFRTKIKKKNRKEKRCLEYSVVDYIAKESNNHMVKKSIYITPELDNLVTKNFVSLSKYVREKLSQDFGNGQPSPKFGGYL